MQRLWYITNPGSGSTTQAKCEAVAALLNEQGLTLVDTTYFPEAEMPTADMLDAANVDTVVLFAGDGTINAALCLLANWDGAFLILPGGTMNLLAKALHHELDPAAIVAAARSATRKIAMPYVEAGQHRGFVGLILGPAAHWFRAREAARSRRLVRLAASVRFAWRRTFGRGMHIDGVPGLGHPYQAIFVSPDARGLLVDAVDAREWNAIAELGWSWLTGEWVAARSVSQQRSESLRIGGHRPVLALIDGEPVTLEPDMQITSGMSRPVFITTREAELDAAA